MTFDPPLTPSLAAVATVASIVSWFIARKWSVTTEAIRWDHDDNAATSPVRVSVERHTDVVMDHSPFLLTLIPGLFFFANFCEVVCRVSFSSGSSWLSLCSPTPARWPRPSAIPVFPVLDQQSWKPWSLNETSLGIFQLFSDKHVFNSSHCEGDSLRTVQPIIPPDEPVYPPEVTRVTPGGRTALQDTANL